MLPENLTVINLDNHDDTELKRAVLDKTTRKYDEVVEYFNI